MMITAKVRLFALKWWKQFSPAIKLLVCKVYGINDVIQRFKSRLKMLWYPLKVSGCLQHHKLPKFQSSQMVSEVEMDT